MKKVVVLMGAITIIFLASCSPTIFKPAEKKSILTFYPELNILSKTSLGNSLVHKDNTLKINSIKIKNPAWYGLNQVGSVGDIFYNVLNTDTLLIYTSSINPTSMSLTGGIIKHKKTNKIGAFATNIYGHLFVGSLSDNFSYEENTIDEKQEIFRQEFIYNGKSGNSIKLTYREYSGDIIRPAFNQDVQYDLSESTIIGYKDLKIEIIRCTNSEIEYKVIKHF